MKKHSSLIALALLSVFLLSACSFPFGMKDPEPFEKGTIIGSSYFNFQAKIKYTIPIGWEGKTGKEAQTSAQEAIDNLDVDLDKQDASVSFLDFSCRNPNTGSNLSITYSPILSSQKFDALVTNTVEYFITKTAALGITFEKIDSFTATIAGRENRVEVLETTYRGVTLKEYFCFCEIDSFACMIVVVPNDFIDNTESFENIIKSFSAIE